MLLARVPHALIRADGSHIDGTRGVGLCARCDRDDPDAQGLFAFFAVHETVTDETVPSVGALIAEWADRVSHRPIMNDQEITDEIDAYLNGDGPS